MYKIINEYEKSFNEEVREKKQIARSARNRASRGVRPVKVHNQSDHLTAKELREMSGEVVSFMQKPMKWKDFKDMPIEAQKRYIEWVRDEYKASAIKIAEMLGVHSVTFGRYNKESLWLTFKSTRMSNKELERWKEFCGKSKNEPVSCDEEKVVEEVAEPEQEEMPSILTRFNIQGESMEEIIQTMTHLAPMVKYGKIVVCLDVVGGERFGEAF